MWEIAPLDWGSAVAIIASGVALLGLFQNSKLAKKNIALSVESQINSYREQWLQRFREAAAGFLANILHDNPGISEWEKIRSHGTMMSLLMNPDDEDYMRFVASVASIVNNKSDGIDIGTECAELANLCQQIFKREWERIKADMRESNAKNK